MTVRLESTIKRFIGMSTDDKPIVEQPDDPLSRALPAGSSFLETDTGKIWRWNGAVWTYPSDLEGIEARQQDAANAAAAAQLSMLMDIRDLMLLQSSAAQLTRPVASEEFLGKVGGTSRKCWGTMAGLSRIICPAAGDYGALDVVSASTSAGEPFIFRNAARVLGGSGLVTSAHVTFSSQTATATTRLWLFHKLPRSSNFNDNVANSIDDDDREKLIGYLDLPALVDHGEVVYSQNITDRLPFRCEDDSDSIYGILNFVAAETNEAANMTMQVAIGVVQD